MQHRIIVLGAGYSGAVAAGRLARRLRREDVAITLVNAEPDFVERVRMHQLATGQALKPRPFSAMFAGTGVELRLGKVTAVDADRRTVTVAGADGTTELAYDTLVYALGSGWNDQGVPGTAEHAHQIASRPGRCGSASASPGSTPGRPWSSSAAGSRAWRPRPSSPRPARTSTSPSPPTARSVTGCRPRGASTCGRSSAGSGSRCTSTPPSPPSRHAGS